MKNPRNQCDGCARGLPVNEQGVHVGDGGPDMQFCTANRYRTVTDGYTTWCKCEHPECGLSVVRPGKVQCWCDHIEGEVTPESRAAYWAKAMAEYEREGGK